MTFNDVREGAWFSSAVTFIAARGITTGTGDGNYSPEARLTRGDFLVLLLRAYGIAPDENLTENFSDAGKTYYTGYLAAAKRLGISAGVGNNMYAPGQEITRQEMFTLLYNTLKAINQLQQGTKLPDGNLGNTLSDFKSRVKMLRENVQIKLSQYKSLYDILVPKGNLLRKMKDNIDLNLVNPMLKEQYGEKPLLYF